MEYIRLGRTGLNVSRFCLGTMNFGGFGNITPEKESFGIMNKALELDINFFDTANVYGEPRGDGTTESIIGRWFSEDRGRRSKVIIATKVYNQMYKDANGVGLTALQIKRCCEDSLRRLKTDYIDIYQMHHVDRNTPWEEIWQAMESLVHEGKVLYIGSSNFAGWDIATANQEAMKRNFMGLVCEQSLYNLLVRAIEREVIPACEYYGVGLIIWSPLRGGLLGGILGKTGEGRRNSPIVQDSLKKYMPQIEKWENFCKKAGENPADMALAWLLHQPAVTSPIIGPRTVSQLEESMRALDIELDNQALDELDLIFPPAGIAPQYYAW